MLFKAKTGFNVSFIAQWDISDWWDLVSNRTPMNPQSGCLTVATLVQRNSVSTYMNKNFLFHAQQSSLTYDVIASKGVRIRVTHRERLSMLSAMWRTSRERSIGRLAWFVLAARQSLRLLTSFAYRSLRTIIQLLSPHTFPGEHKHKSTPLKWDSPTESDAHRNL